jgi:hypothetical protein
MKKEVLEAFPGTWLEMLLLLATPESRISGHLLAGPVAATAITNDGA